MPSDLTRRTLAALEQCLPYLPDPCPARYAAEDAVADLRHALKMPPLTADAPDTAPVARSVA